MSWLLFLLLIPVAIGVAEGMRLMVARLTGVGVRRIGIGVGPRLKVLRERSPQLTLQGFPIGLLVEFIGGTRHDQKALDELAPEEKASGFFAKGYGVRLVILMSGAIACVLLAWLLLATGSLLNPPPAPVVGGVTPETPAAEAGLQAADRIVAVDGEPVAYLFDVFRYAFESNGAPLQLEIEREGERFHLHLDTQSAFEGDNEFRPDRLGIEAPSLTRVARVLPDQAAAAAGIRSGDWIRRINAHEVSVWAEVLAEVEATGENPAEFVVEREGALTTVTVTPRIQIWRDLSGRPIRDAEGKPQMRPMIGAVGDMGRLYGAEPSVVFAIGNASEQLITMIAAVPLRIASIATPDREGDRVQPYLKVDLELGLIEAERPWYRIGGEVFVYVGLFLLLSSFVGAARGRAVIRDLLAGNS